MSALSSALAAMDKATPGEWATWQTSRDGCGYLSIGPLEMVPGTHDAIVCDVTLLLTVNETDLANAKVIRASKLALAWIEKALPYIEAYAETMRDSREEWDQKNVARLDALIARAKP